MTTLEIALRSSTITLHLLFAILCFQARREFFPLRYCAPHSLGCAAYAYMSAWPAPFALNIVLSTLVCTVPATFWLLTASLCNDRFAPSRGKHAALAAMAVLGLTEGLTDWDWPWLMRLYIVAAIVFMIAGMVEVISGLLDDLVQSRRQMRFGLLLLGPLYAFVLFAVELAYPGISLRDLGRTVNSWGLAVPVWLAAIAFLKPRTLTLFAVPAATAVLPRPPADPRETVQLDKLKKLMEEDRLYRDESLNVASLATQMGMAENRLRTLINTRLGHRNFSTFVNGYRLSDAIASLSDPSQIEVPILTIALDAGFGSIGPFNRAFKADTGLTPRDFRTARLGETSV